MKILPNSVLTLVCTIICILFTLSAPVWSGDLEPPDGSPSPTMKTLDQIEPRIPIPGSVSPIETFEITQPGSYYLTGDRKCASSGISITNCANVTIDLCGYYLGRSLYQNDAGIVINAGCTNVDIRNGSIWGFQYGVYIQNSMHIKVSGLRIFDCLGGGVYFDDNEDYPNISRHNQVSECTIHRGNWGIRCGSEENPSDNTYNKIDNNLISNASFAAGIYVHSNGNTIIGNRVDNCLKAVFVDDDAIGNVIADNIANDNGYGFLIGGSGNIVIRNVSVSNSTNYAIDPSNQGSIATDPATAGPWDNIEY